MQLVLADVPLGHVLVDLYRPLPLRWNQIFDIFVVLDNFFRFVLLYPLKKATLQATIKNHINEYTHRYGPNLI